MDVSEADLFEASPIAHVVCDGAGRVVRVNDAAAHLCRPVRAAAPAQDDARPDLVTWLGTDCGTQIADLLAAARAAPDHPQILPHLALPTAPPDRRFALYLRALPPVREQPALGQAANTRTAGGTKSAGAGAGGYVGVLLEAPADPVLQAYRAALDAAKVRFLKTASHDLRQPMNALNLFLGVLLASKSMEQVHAVAGRMQATVDAINETFATMLELARLEMGTVTVSPVGTDLRAVAQDVLTAYEDTASGTGLALRLAGRSRTVVTDPAYLARLLRCLVANAVRVTETGGVLLAIRQRAQGIRLDVFDTGPGFTEDQGRLIFEPFYRIDAGAEAGADRYGLGLSVVRSIAAVLGLGLEATARPGRGARFSVLFPAP